MGLQAEWQHYGGNAAEQYQGLLVPAIFGPWAARLVELAEIRDGERILDVACGTGAVTRLAAVRTGTTGRVVGLDINPGMLSVARAQPDVEGAPIEWIEASALEMPLPDGSFDVVLCQHGLQQIPDRARRVGTDRGEPGHGRARRGVGAARRPGSGDDPPRAVRPRRSTRGRGAPEGRRFSRGTCPNPRRNGPISIGGRVRRCTACRDAPLHPRRVLGRRPVGVGRRSPGRPPPVCQPWRPVHADGGQYRAGPGVGDSPPACPLQPIPSALYDDTFLPRGRGVLTEARGLHQNIRKP